MNRGHTRSSINKVLVDEKQQVVTSTMHDVKDEPISTPIIDNETVSYEKILFISNRSANKKLKELLHIQEFDSQHFVNRTLKQLHDEFAISYLWLDLSNKKAKKYFCENIIRSDNPYTLICAFNNWTGTHKHSKLMQDLVDLDKVNLFIKYNDLCGIKSLNATDFLDKLKNHVSIHDVVSCLDVIWNATKKKK